MPLLRLFPGLTPAGVWALPYEEFVILATAVDHHLKTQTGGQRRGR